MFLLSTGATAAETLETRCGWFENPTPANSWLIDKEGEWIIGTQGGNHADGDGPEFKAQAWVITNSGERGYGCACIKGIFDHSKKKFNDVIRIVSAKAKPLKQCQNDTSLPPPSCKKVEKVHKKLVCTDNGDALKGDYEDTR